MAVVAHLARHFAPVVDFVYPPRCPSCGMAIASQAGLCADCWSSLEVPAHAEAAGHAMPVYAATYYNDTSRKLVLAYKHGGRIALSRLLARLMAARLPAGTYERYLGILCTIASQTVSAGAVNAFLTKDYAKWFPTADATN